MFDVCSKRLDYRGGLHKEREWMAVEDRIRAVAGIWSGGLTEWERQRETERRDIDWGIYVCVYGVMSEDFTLEI